jgi:hypothetical protein
LQNMPWELRGSIPSKVADVRHSFGSQEELAVIA